MMFVLHDFYQILYPLLLQKNFADTISSAISLQISLLIRLM